MPICAIGAVRLTIEEILQFQVFVDEQLLEYEARRAGRREQYVIAPHVKEEKSRDWRVHRSEYTTALAHR